MNGVLSMLALVLVTESGTPTAADSVAGGLAGPPPPPASALHALSALALPRARVTMSGRRYELVQPLFTERGIGWRSVEGFPRRRPAVIASADWDSVKAPPNPVPWPAVAQLESITGRSGAGTTTGAIVGFVLVGLPAIGLVAAGDMYGDSFNASTAYPVAIGFALLATVAGASIGRALIPGAPVWTPLPLPAASNALPGDPDARGP